MFKFIVKRVGISLAILLASSLLMYVMVIHSGDPLEDLREVTDANRDHLIAQRIEYMGLDLPWYTRYWNWLVGILGCFKGQCDWGLNRSGTPVGMQMGNAITTSLRLVFMSVILAMVLGIFLGVVTAIRKYSGFDYTITFIAFVLYSLPSFVFAVLLKEFAAIRFNDWVAEPRISVLTSAIIGILLGLLVAGLVGGHLKRKLIAGGIFFLITFGMLQFFSVTKFFASPITGLFVEGVTAIAAAVLFTALFTGFGNKRAIIVTLATGIIAFVIVAIFSNKLWEPTWGFMFLLLAGFIVLAVAAGYFFGDYARRSVIWANIWTVVSVWLAIFLDYVARYWAQYIDMRQGRPIPTVGSVTPNFPGADTFWLSFTDSVAHVILPTLSLTLMSLASYTRYTRASMLEVLDQDYIRTARSKGLPEHTVITRHAFRNAMLPILTIVAFDFASLIGGAVITETVFGWQGMGKMFQTGLSQVDPNPVMAFSIVTGGVAVLMNMLADILYAYVDPRIRR